LSWIKKAQHGILLIEDVKSLIEQRKFLYLKFVRLKNEEYRFAEVSAYNPNHKMLAQNDDIESAGFVQIDPDDGFFTEGHSMTLKMGMDGKDDALFSKLLGLPVKEDY